MIQEILQQAQAHLKQTEITAMVTMNVSQPALVMRQGAQVNDLQVSQAGRQHQAGDAITMLRSVHHRLREQE